MLVVGLPNIRGGLAGWLSGEESTCEVGNTDSIPGSGRPLSRTWQPAPVFLFKKKKKNLFIFWLHWIFVVACVFL